MLEGWKKQTENMFPFAQLLSKSALQITTVSQLKTKSFSKKEKERRREKLKGKAGQSMAKQGKILVKETSLCFKHIGKIYVLVKSCLGELKVIIGFLCFTERNIMTFDLSCADLLLGLQMSVFDLTILNKVGTLISVLMFACIIF